MSSTPYDPVQHQIEVLERIATALEQMALGRMGRSAILVERDELIHGPSYPEPPLPTPPPELLAAQAALVTKYNPAESSTVALPPVQPFQFTGPSAFCPVHRVPWKTVPAGVSKRTGAPYESFLACPERGCNEKPRAPR